MSCAGIMRKQKFIQISEVFFSKLISYVWQTLGKWIYLTVIVDLLVYKYKA